MKLFLLKTHLITLLEPFIKARLVSQSPSLDVQLENVLEWKIWAWYQSNSWAGSGDDQGWNGLGKGGVNLKNQRKIKVNVRTYHGKSKIQYRSVDKGNKQLSPNVCLFLCQQDPKRNHSGSLRLWAQYSESVAKFDQRSLRIFYLFIDIIIRLCAMGQNWSRDS